ncbi:MAG TPA: RND transporter, partial [Nitrospiraceae bacterium]|nr:RND transporter [Nitrospiraceae bacterium]
MASKLTRISVDRPKLIIAAIIVLTIFFLVQFPKIVTDTDPKNMLPATSPVRVYNDEMESLFALHKDMIALGIVNDKGIFNQDTLTRIASFSEEIKKI